jgi:ketosteroid isomerase-like protein
MKDDVAEILALEQQRCRAEVAGDTATLERLLDDDLVHVHANGVIDGKTSLLVARKNVKFLEMTRRDLQVQVSGDLAVLTGGLLIRAQPAGGSEVHTFDAFSTQVLARRGGEWRFTLHQGTTLKK